jgi:L-asparaginase
MTARPRIAVIGTGGTISSLGLSSLDVLEYPDFGRKLPVADILAMFPETALVAEPVPLEFRSLSSTAITPRDWCDLRALIHETVATRPDIAGFVILHGTATLEETAFFLNLTLRTACPVVLVGAQRPASALSSDAGMNLVNALRVAGDVRARGMGVLVVLNDEIHTARDVTKTATYRLQTFRSPDYGPIGQVDGDGVHFARAPLGRHAPDGAFAEDALDSLPRVDIVASYAGADGVMIDALVAAGARGIVSAGMAPGIVTPQELKALQNAQAQGVVVVQCSRALGGRVAPRRALREGGIVAGQDFNPQKARILLSLALIRGRDPDAIGGIFAEH